MKEGKVIEAFKLLSGIKLNVVGDKETRTAIISNYLQMHKVVQAHDEEVRVIYNKLFEGKDEDLNAVNVLRHNFRNATTTKEREEALQGLNNYTHIFDLERELDEIFSNRAKEDVEIDIVKFDRDMFINACADSGVEFTMGNIVGLGELFKNDAQEHGKG